MKIRILLVLVLIGVWGCEEEKGLPKALMYKGEPIHPELVVGTQIGDGSRLEPVGLDVPREGKLLEYWQGCDVQIDELNYEYDRGDNYVSCSIRYHVNELSASSEENSYSYIGKYKDKYILSMYNHGGGTGRFGFLGMIRREGDTIRAAGDIASGDRGLGGYMMLRGIKGNKLRFAQSASPGMVDRALGAEKPKSELLDKYWHGMMFDSPLMSVLYLVYEVDLDQEKVELDRKLVGVELEHDMGQHTVEEPRNIYDLVLWGYGKVAQEYYDQDKRVLDLAQAKEYMTKVYEEVVKKAKAVELPEKV